MECVLAVNIKLLYLYIILVSCYVVFKYWYDCTFNS